MGCQSSIDALPGELRAELDALLIKHSFSNYVELADHIRNKGGVISKSSLHRYGQKLDRRLQAIKASTDAAKLLAAQVEDTENHLSGSVISLVQSELFETLLNLQDADLEDDPAERMKLLSNAAKSIAEVSRASIANKKWQAEVRVKAEAAATKVTDIARKGGLSADTAETIRREILGIAN